jgi:hypothetical protein
MLTHFGQLCGCFATREMIYLQSSWRRWTLPRNMPELLCGQMKKVSLATGELQKASPPICPAER